MKRLTTVTLFALIVFSTLPRAADTSLMEAVRRGDTQKLKLLANIGSNMNLKDDTGATALMYASIYGSLEDMEVLIARGAEVNAANAYQSTALMWAAGDAARVKLLLDHGAKVDARAVDRSTALLVAARYGHTDAMRLLIARGADPKAVSSDTVNLLRVAYASENPDVRLVLKEAGVELKDPNELGTPVIAMNGFDPPLVKQLLASGADPKKTFAIASVTYPTIGFLASSGQVETVRTLIDHGVDPNTPTTHGWTPLMLAANAPVPDMKMVDLLLSKGADLKAHDEYGHTALDWALTAGDTPMARRLEKAGAARAGLSEPAPVAVATPRTARAAIEKAISRLQPVGPTFYEHNKCISCHNESLPAMAVKAAMDHEIPVDRALGKHPTEATLAVWKAGREQVLLGNREAIGGFVANLSYGLIAMADEGITPNAVTDAMAYGLAMSQHRNGTFTVVGGNMRPPLGGATDIHLTALTIRALTQYSVPGRQQDTNARIDRALDFLETAKAMDTQDEALTLLGFKWADASAKDRADQARRLLALQRKDGGWGQLPTMDSDAYATGQALYALYVNGLPATDAAYRKGVEYLLRTQLEDGTWFVRSRGFPFQPYFDTGFPGGKNQFISAAATSWASLALAFSL